MVVLWKQNWAIAGANCICQGSFFLDFLSFFHFRFSILNFILIFALPLRKIEFELWPEFVISQEKSEGVIVEDDAANFIYPMPMNAHGKDEVFVGRLRRDETQPKTLNMWIVADNLRKGAATNAVQIAEYLSKNGLLH